MKNKKKIIIGILITMIIIAMGVLVGVNIYNQKNNTEGKTIAAKKGKEKENITETLTKVEKEIAGIDTTKEDEEKEKEEETYSDLYKEYLELPEEEKEKSDVIPRKEEVPFEKLEEIKEIIKEDDEEAEEDENKIPERFNLAEKIDIKVENQGSYGLCWGFASLKSLETYLAVNNLGNYDFSELHLDYIESEHMYGGRKLHDGGSFSIFKDYVIESGVVLEEKVPYDYHEYTEEEYMKFADFEKVIEVTETVEFPSIYKSGYSEYTEEEIKEFRETVKKHIMKNGGLYTCIVSTPNKNHYTAPDTDEWTNHAVTIVGWDDNYSKENFLSSDGKKPNKDGAYIALNSWGTFCNDGGYYYISYEDKYVESDLSGIISTSMENAYKISSIKNEGIRNYLKENHSNLFIKHNGEDYITKNALSKISSLDLSNRNLTSIEGIEIFTNIYDLNLSNNKITDATPITKIKNLSYLNLSNNNISNIDFINNMETVNIYTLNLANNKIKNVSVIANIEREESWSSLDLDISNNPNVKGYEKINNAHRVNLSGCNITDVSVLQPLENIRWLNISNTPGIKGLEKLPQYINTLDISNCELTEIPELNKNISTLDISNNKIDSLDGIEKFEALFELDISGNIIDNWDAISKLTMKTFDEDNEIYYEEGNISITANNCNIEDISVFNGLTISAMLDLKDNNIKDISNFENEKVYYIDLSNNRDITGLETLKNTSTVFLNNCNISDLSEILKLEKVCSLGLENNNITDITQLSNLKELTSLSLAGNKQLCGTITKDNLYLLNLSDCNLDNTFNIAKLSNIGCLNISKNPKIDNIKNIIDNIKYDYASIVIDEIDMEQYIEIKENNTNISMYGVLLNFNYILPENENKIDVSKNKVLRNNLMKNMASSFLKIDNGYLYKNARTIDIIDINKDCVEMELNDWGGYFYDTTVRIIFNPDYMQNEDEVLNNNDENSIKNDSTDIDINIEDDTLLNTNKEQNNTSNTTKIIKNNTNINSNTNRVY